MIRSILLLLLLFTTSCSTVQKISMKVGFINIENRIKLGDSKETATKILGKAQIKININDEEIHIYEESVGFICYKKEKVTCVSRYSSELQPILSAQQGDNLIQSIQNLGPAEALINRNKKIVLFYPDGAIISDGKIILKSITKLYSSNINFIVNVSSYSDNSARKKSSYFILPGNKNISPADLQFREVSSYLKSILENRGDQTVSTMDDADYIMIVNYGISDPKEDISVVSRSIFLPQYIQGTTTNVYGSHGNFLGSASSSGSWQSTYAGSITQIIEDVTYTRWINLEAIDYKKYLSTKQFTPVWKVLSQSTGYNSDLRKVIPPLVLGVQELVDTDSGSTQNYTIDDTAINNFYYHVKLTEL